MRAVSADAYLQALLSAPRPGADRVLAFFDQRVGCIGTDARLMLLPLDDHICHRGDGLFESICYRQGRILALSAHLERLRQGAEALAITPPCPWDEIRQRVLDVARASGRQEGDLRIFLSRGPGGFGISPGECPTAGLYMVALKAKPLDPALYQRGLTAFTSRIPPKQDYLASIKSTNYLPNVLMAAEATARGQDVAVSFDEDGFMGEAAIANLAIIDSQGQLRCPDVRRILPGTTMLAALELARGREGLESLQGPVHRDEIATAREMLLFTSSSLCVGISHFDGQPVGQGEQRGKPGPLAHWFREALRDHMLEEGTPF